MTRCFICIFNHIFLHKKHASFHLLLRKQDDFFTFILFFVSFSEREKKIKRKNRTLPPPHPKPPRPPCRHSACGSRGARVVQGESGRELSVVRLKRSSKCISPLFSSLIFSPLQFSHHSPALSPLSGGAPTKPHSSWTHFEGGTGIIPECKTRFCIIIRDGSFQGQVKGAGPGGRGRGRERTCRGRAGRPAYPCAPRDPAGTVANSQTPTGLTS